MTGSESLITCSCGNILGVWLAPDTISSRHRGRTWDIQVDEGVSRLRITCCQCKRVNLIQIRAGATRRLEPAPGRVDIAAIA